MDTAGAGDGKVTEGRGVYLMVHGRPLDKMEYFQYLWRLLIASDSNCTLVQENLLKFTKS